MGIFRPKGPSRGLWVPWGGSLWHKRAGVATPWKYFNTLKFSTNECQALTFLESGSESGPDCTTLRGGVWGEGWGNTWTSKTFDIFSLWGIITAWPASLVQHRAWWRRNNVTRLLTVYLFLQCFLVKFCFIFPVVFNIGWQTVGWKVKTWYLDC